MDLEYEIRKFQFLRDIRLNKLGEVRYVLILLVCISLLCEYRAVEPPTLTLYFRFRSPHLPFLVILVIMKLTSASPLNG